MRSPSSTYRLQIRPGFTLDDAASAVPYLHLLGVGWVYLSPILTAVRGSEHGYDVADPTSIDPERGGPGAFERLSAAAHGLGMGVIVDIVPNHVGVAEPEQNPWWWSLLRDGESSPYADAFDVDWPAGGGKVLLPLLGSEDDLDGLRVDGDRLYLGELALPIAPGTAGPGDAPREVAGRQHYELIPWREGDARLNYRRFFTITSLAGLRVEVPEVFDAAHAEVRRWFDEGLADGLRIDHPDGLADPVGYLRRLRELTGGAYTVVEKILEPGEQLPAEFACEGTTGYDALGLVDRLFVDPAGQQRLDELDASLRADGTGGFERLAREAKREIATGPLAAEMRRLARLVPGSSAALTNRDQVTAALGEIAAAFPIYRTYLPDVTGGEGVLASACRDAAVGRPDLGEAIAALEPLLADPGGELCRRFQQTTGMVMAKGVEDTAFYRFSRLGTLTEVGADPGRFAVGPDEFHARAGEREQAFPRSLTALTTHDTKRSEDARARISVISELADEWSELVPALLDRAPLPDRGLANLVWQAIVGAWPADAERLTDYALKAAREAGLHTTWIDQDAEFETQLRALVASAFEDPVANRLVADFVRRVEPFGASNGLSAKLVQLAGPGVPDVYQGTEFWDRSLADPDNRRPVDFAARAAALKELDSAMLEPAGQDPAGQDPAGKGGAAQGGAVVGDAAAGGGPVPPATAPEAKLLVVSRTLRLRRNRPELFEGYVPLDATGPAAEHVVGFRRGAGGAVVLATRLPVGLERRGGWGDTAVVLPWPTKDAFTGAEHEPGRVQLADALAALPVALLVPEVAR